MSAVDVIEEAIVAMFLEEITEEEAIARVRAVLNVTEVGARDLLWHQRSARSRYQAAFDRTRAALQELGDG